METSEMYPQASNDTTLRGSDSIVVAFDRLGEASISGPPAGFGDGSPGPAVQVIPVLVEGVLAGVRLAFQDRERMKGESVPERVLLELRATLEELETTNEELQVTVAELEARVSELTVENRALNLANDDLQLRLDGGGG